MFKKIIASVVGVVAFVAAGPAYAHVNTSYSGWYVWGSPRSAWEAVSGHARMEATYRPGYCPGSSLPTNPHCYGWNLYWVDDYSQDGDNNCTELWVDFKRNNGAGTHRNPTVYRHCNTYGNWSSGHGGITDAVEHVPYAGWGMAVCWANRTGDGRWHRNVCKDENGADALHMISSSRNHVTDWELTSNCYSNPNDTRGAYAGEPCRAYLHII